MIQARASRSGCVFCRVLGRLVGPALLGLLLFTGQAIQAKEGTFTLGARIGQDVGEAYLSLLVPVYAHGQSILFFNPRGALKDEGETEGNLGLGFRRMFGDNDFILGANVYRDYRRSKFGNTWKQWGAGLEFLSNWVDARANYYKPEDRDILIAEAAVQAVEISTDVDVTVGRSTSVVRTSEDLGTTSTTSAPTGIAFSGHGLAASTTTTNVNQIRNTTTTTIRTVTTQTTTTNTTTTNMFFEQFEGALEGWDAEIGVKLPLAEHLPEVRLFYGYYDFDKRYGGEIRGPKGRLEIRAGPYFTLDAEVFDDKELNDTKYFIGARFHMPFDLAKLFRGQNPFGFKKQYVKQFRNRPLINRVYEDVLRDVRIQTSESEYAENKTRRRQNLEQQVGVIQRVDIQTFSESEIVTTTNSSTNRFNYTINGNADFIEHFDSNDGGAGADDGTFESPHTSLVTGGGASQNSREVNLLHGDSSFDNGGNDFNIESNEILVSESSGNTATINTDQGAVTLPEANPGAGSVASISNGSVVINSDNVKISNVTFNNGGLIETASAGSHSNITISDVTITGATNAANNSSAAITLGGGGGTVHGSINLDNVRVEMPGTANEGILIQDSTAGQDLDLVAMDVFVDGHGGDLFVLSNLNGQFAFTNVDMLDSETITLGIAGGNISGTVDSTSSTTVTNAAGNAVSVSGGHTGQIDYAGTINDMGDGLAFSNADGIYNFTGTVNLGEDNNAATNALRGISIDSSAGTFNFSANTSMFSTRNNGYTETGGSATVTYNGTIDQDLCTGLGCNGAVEISGKTGGTTTFNGVIGGNIAAAEDEFGISISNSGGTISFNGGGNLTAGGSSNTAAINIDNSGGSNGTLTVNITDMTVNGNAGTGASGIQAAANNTAAAAITLNVTNANVTGGTGAANQGGGAGIGGAGGTDGNNGSTLGDFVDITLTNGTVTGGNGTADGGGGAGVGGGGGGNGATGGGGLPANTSLTNNGATLNGGSGGGNGAAGNATGSGGDGN